MLRTPRHLVAMRQSIRLVNLARRAVTRRLQEPATDTACLDGREGGVAPVCCRFAVGAWEDCGGCSREERCEGEDREVHGCWGIVS
jgi:hypothetical protein